MLAILSVLDIPVKALASQLWFQGSGGRGLVTSDDYVLITSGALGRINKFWVDALRNEK